MFKLWSDTKPEVKKELKPDLGLRGWNELDDDEKLTMWQHLDWYFFDKDKRREQYKSGESYRFFGGYGEEQLKEERIYRTIMTINEMYKAKNYAPTFLENTSLNSACQDFLSIFMKQEENIVMEMFSIYCKAILLERADKEPYKNEKETAKDFTTRTKEWRFEEFDKFTERLNEVFGDFGINFVLTRQGFIPRQEKHITQNIFEPVLEFLADKKWEKVNEHFSEAFNKHTHKDYSASITHTVSAIQAFLQILVNGNAGKGNISELIKQAQTKNLIPNDSFSIQIFKNIESVFARERQSKGMAHPMIEKPDELNSRLMLNLGMVFLQHCIQKEK